MRTFVAPGKVLLVGEYAVVDGAPAVVAAVDSGVAVAVSDGPERVITPTDDDRFARAALKASGAPPAQYVFSTWNPPSTREKVGLGGSAAATVAGVLAGYALSGAATGRVVTTAMHTHRAVQGSGSGADVLASALGGVLQVQGTQATPLPRVSPVVVYSGTPARTGPRVEQYLRWHPRDAFVHRSAAITRAFRGDPVAALRASGALIAEMARAARIPYLTPGLTRIMALAVKAGGAAKPSGAGGGDIAVALFADPGQALAFRTRCLRDGFLVLPVRVCGGAHELTPPTERP